MRLDQPIQHGLFGTTLAILSPGSARHGTLGSASIVPNVVVPVFSQVGGGRRTRRTVANARLCAGERQQKSDFECRAPGAMLEHGTPLDPELQASVPGASRFRVSNERQREAV